MDPEMAKKIEETVLEVLKNSNMDSTTEFQVRKSASEKLCIDLSKSERKKLVRNVVQTYLEEQQSKAEADEKPTEEGEEEAEEEDSEDEKKKGKKGGKEYDDDGDLIVCRLSNKRRVTLTEFKGKGLVSIREYYQKDGKELPSNKAWSRELDKDDICCSNQYRLFICNGNNESTYQFDCGAVVNLQQECTCNRESH